MDALEQLGVVPVDYAVLRSLFLEWKFPKNKIATLEKEGKLVRLKQGMYVVSPSVTKKLLSIELIANHIYGPSYVSMESALRYYGLIPEQVNTVLSVTTKRSKSFENAIGTFGYVGVNENYYAIGIYQENISENITFQIATREKALCDILTTTPYLDFRSVTSLRTYLEDDLRFDMLAIESMNADIIAQCIETGKKKNVLRLLLKLLQR